VPEVAARPLPYINMPPMSDGPQMIVFETSDANPQPLHERLATRGLAPRRIPLDIAAAAPLDRLEVAIISLRTADPDAELEPAAALLERLVGDNVPTLVCGAPDNLRWTGGPLVEWVEPGASLDEIVGRLTTLTRYAPLINRMQRELDHLHRLGDQLNRYFSEIDQEMRLAGRLQRDFLPATLPQLPGVNLSALYRPASWVSGDLYDAFRIDEEHIGLFVADAMGHGVAAGLLTMFMRQALTPKRVSGRFYEIVSPPRMLAELHACLVRQKLPNCQFVTAVYAILNVRSRELRLSRAGHPCPLHARADGEIAQLNPTGGLLGLADLDGEFEETRLTLAPGDKIVLFTDGLETDFFSTPPTQTTEAELSPALRNWLALPLEEFTDAVRAHLDMKEGSLHPPDDVTLLALQVQES
jgi:sigma-B regulation protein RsbU (phosphoserine phosphatase)